ncbi:MAG: tRNA pseudouridine(55) synthase TruB [Arsenophonus sp.]|nr:MAG: tRNA pseudouridine(55) synthase TruB [Arsenophonus sp.]
MKKKYRDVNGILLLDKPNFVTSNYALQKTRILFKAKKAGHTGSLDPLATGMLPICFGNATKFSQFLLNANKNYQVIAHLGISTNTADSTGSIIKQRTVNITEKKLNDVLNYFNGLIYQTVPTYSAIKYNGIPRYKYARKGITIPSKRRPIMIHHLKLKRWVKKELELDILCSKGTYIRSLIDDIGNLLGCGAHVSYLRRLNVANYITFKLITLEKLNNINEKNKNSSNSLFKELDSLLLPIETAISHLPIMNLSTKESIYFQKNRYLNINNHTYLKGDFIKITEGIEKKIIGIGKIIDKEKIFLYQILKK